VAKLSALLERETTNLPRFIRSPYWWMLSKSAL